jgi:PAS domain S-box-containing protein
MKTTLRVLIIEDYESDAVLLLQRIRRHGFSPHYQIVSTSAELAKALDQEEWDIIISDYVLPGFSGLEALKLIQARKPEIPVILVSGKIYDEVALEAIRAGAKDYIAKDDLGRLGFAIDRELLELNVRKQTKEALQESEAFSFSLLNNAPNPVIVTNPDTSIRYVNPAFEQLTGFTVAEVVGVKPAYPYWSMKSSIGEPSNFEKMILSKTAYREERTFRKKNGELFQAEVAGVPVLDREGNLKYFIFNWVDVTERKKMEEQLRQAARYARSLIEASLDPLVTISSEGKITDVNKETEEVTGISRNELIGSDFCEYFTDPLKARQGYERVFLEGLVKDYPLEVRHKSGRTIDVLYNASVYHDDAGQVQGVFAAARDITGLKQLEQMLRQERDQAKKLLEIAPFIILTLNLDGEVTLINAKGSEILGYGAEEIVGKKWIDSFIPEKRRPEVKDIFSKYKSGIDVPVECNENLVLNSKGQERLIAWHNIVIRNEKNQIIGTLSTGEDISDRKQAQEALRKSEEKYRLLFETMRDGFVRVNMSGFVIESNKAFKDLVGYSEAELQSLGYFDLTPPKWNAMEAKIVEEEVFPRGYSRVYEKEYRRQDGTIVPVELRTCLVKDTSGKPVEMWAIVRDITSRMVTQAALRESEERFASFMDHSPATAWMKDENGRYVYLNRTLEKVLGVKLDDWRGKRDDQVWPSEIAGQYINTDQEVLKSGLAIEVVERALNRKGEQEYILVLKFPFRDSSGKRYVGGIGLNITDRRQVEEALKRTKEQLRKFSIHLQELLESEKKHLAVEIHDELGQMLTALKIDLSWLAKRIPPDLEPLSRKTQSMMELINETDKVVKRISSNLRPPILDDLGLNEALRWLCGQFQERTGIKCFLKVLESDICSKRQNIDIFRIVQEALTNVARHSEATTVRITMQNEADNLVITIRDNGKGISKSQIESDKSYGIMGMQERARMLGGELTIKGNYTKGTVVKLVIPARKQK